MTSHRALPGLPGTNRKGRRAHLRDWGTRAQRKLCFGQWRNRQWRTAAQRVSLLADELE